MRRAGQLSALIGMLVLTSEAAAGREPPQLSPAPAWERYKDLGEAAVRARLPGDGSWEVEWPNGHMPFEWRHKGRFPGHLTCGRIRSTTPVKDWRPITSFVIVIDQDQVKTLDISSRADNSLVNVICNAWVAQGKLPPVPTMNTANDRSSEITSLGLTLRVMPEGGYVSTVASGSAAQRLGLVPGMVITSINGVALAGMGDVMTKVLAAAPAGASLTLADGRTLLLAVDK